MTPDVPALLEEARGYLVGVGDLDEGEPVPREEVAAQLKAVGFGGGRDEPPADWFVDQAVGEGDLVEVDGGLELPSEVATDDVGPQRYLAGEDHPRPLDAYDVDTETLVSYGYDAEEIATDAVRAEDAAIMFTADEGDLVAPRLDAAEEPYAEEVHRAACRVVETAIVDALLAGRDVDTVETGETPETADIDTRGDGSSTDDPQGETDEDDLEARSLQAFAAAIDFFAAQLDRDISDAFDDAPDTPRDYYTGYRGWSEETISAKKLGYAPADDQALLDHLMREGFDGDAIQGTGLFYEDFTPHFQGRYVLPYFDGDGRPVYAISRSLNDREDGHPRDPKGDQKYTKAIKTKDRTYVDEPIYGRETVDDDTDRLLVAGGIADAITLHEAGEACISPVTTVRFKSKHEPVVVDLVDRHDLEGVYMLNDAERPSVDRTQLEDGETADAIGDVLTIKQYGEGERAAFGNAEFLLDEGVDPFLARLPGGDDDLRKLDPDDYVKESWGSVDALLRSARHAESHPGYTDWASRRREREVRKAVRTGDADGRSSSGGSSGLWELEFTDVSGMSVGDRQNNPLGHHGNSEGYFVCADKGGFVHGFDHKYGVAYNAVSYLLCDAGERRASDPNGPLTDWEVFVAWQHAKANRHLPEDDPVPYRALLEVAVRDGLVDGVDLVERDADEGDVVEDPDPSDDTYTALPPGTYDDVLEHVEETYGVDPGRDPAGGAGDDEDRSAGDTERPRDLLKLDVVVEPADAMQAARAVRPDDLDRDLPELERDDVDDVAIAVALAEGVIDDADTFPRDDGYTEAYYRARDAYGAPLPKYLDNSTLEERFDLVTAAVERLGPEHILDTCRSEVTVENPPGHAIAKLDPTWEDSKSGERIVAGYGAGFWCAEHETSFSPLQLVALEHGIIDEETQYPTGEGYKRAYRLLREEYDAPLPRWRATVLEEVTVLPPSVRVIDEDYSATGGFDLDAARKETEALVRDAVTTPDRAQLVTVVPGGGKTFSTAIVAGDHPILYAPPRNELKKQMEEYAREVRESDEFDAEPTAYHLPILAENTLRDEVLKAAVAAVRGDEVALRDREELLDVADGVRDDLDDDPERETDDDGVELERATCPTAEGEHGEAWRVAVQVARALGLTPATIHQHEKALFGEELPCHDGGVCEYTAGWDRARDAEACPDILIGSTGHAFVDSATTHYATADGERVTTPRAVVVDEFPGDAYASEYGERYMDHAVWLAEALVGVETRDELLDAELASDTWVSSWLEGDGGDVVAAADAVETLRAGANIVDAVDAAGRLLERDPIDLAGGLTSANLRGVVDTLETLVETPPGRIDLADVRDDLGREEDQIATDADRAYAQNHDAEGLYALADTLREEIVEPVDAAAAALGDRHLDDAVADTTADLPIGGDLRDLVDDAVSAARGDAPGELLTAAADALEGGRDGCRALAVGAPGGYAHPDAWALLAGAIARPEDDGVSVGRQRTLTLGDAAEGIQHKSLTVNGADIHADRNHHGAVVFDRPSFTDAEGGTCPLVGLDATARRDLWRIALGRDAEVRDIHDTAASRRRHIREGMKHTVVQTANTPLPYHGDPTGRNFQEDLAVVEAAAEEYTGPGGLDTKGPAVISTLKVLDYLDAELEDLADETVNYENMKGSDALGDHQVAVVLGSQHYGDTEPERWAMYAGESADRGETSGETLDYGSGVANTYLKHMREDHTMQAILRAGRNDDRSVVVAHTSALRDDLPVVAEGATVSAHSKGALAVADAAADMNERSFTAADVVEKIADDDRGVGLRQVQNILADLRSAGYLGVETQGSRGRQFEYEFGDDPGLADVELPNGEAVGADQNKTKSELLDTYSWNFVLDSDGDVGESMLPPPRATIPATDTVEAVVADGDPPS